MVLVVLFGPAAFAPLFALEIVVLSAFPCADEIVPKLL